MDKVAEAMGVMLSCAPSTPAWTMEGLHSSSHPVDGTVTTFPLSVPPTVIGAAFTLRGTLLPPLTCVVAAAATGAAWQRRP
jgi:hypothetical protein